MVLNDRCRYSNALPQAACGLTLHLAEVMVHALNRHGLFIFTNNSGKRSVWEIKAVVSARKRFSSEAICKRALQGQPLMSGEKDHTVQRYCKQQQKWHPSNVRCFFFFFLPLQRIIWRKRKKDSQMYIVGILRRTRAACVIEVDTMFSVLWMLQRLRK